MKLTKLRLQQLIKEEFDSISESDGDWYSAELETMADRKFADRPSSTEDIQTDELHLPFDPKLDEFREIMADLGMAVAYHYKGRGADRAKAHELVLDVIKSAVEGFEEDTVGGDELKHVLDDVYEEEEAEDLEQRSREDEEGHWMEEGKADTTDKKSTEPKGATKAEKAEDKRRKRRTAKQALKET